MSEKVIKWNDKLLVWNNSYIRTSTPTPSYPTDGLIARYTLEDDLTDTTGNYNGSGSITYGTGKIGKCGVWTTSKNVINTTIPATFFDGNDKWTVCMWFKSTSPNNYLAFMSNFNGTAANRTCLYYVYGNINVTRGVKESNGSNDYGDGNWHMLLAYYDGSNYKCEIDNGDETVTLADTNTLTTTGITSMGIANRPDEGESQFVGSIDQVYFYNKVLDSNEKAQLWNNGNGV